MKDSITLANEIAKVKEDIRKAISNRGVEITETTRFADYPAKIMDIDTQNQAEDVYFRDPNFEDTEIAIPGNYGFVADYALANKNLDYVDFGNVTAVGVGSFANNSKLNTDLTDAKKLKFVGDRAFSNCNYETVNSDTIKYVGAGAFSNNRDLVEVYLKNAEILQSGAFSNNEKLDYVKAKNCKKIGTSCFMDDTQLNRIDLPLVEQIDDYAFYNCGSVAYTETTDGETYKLSLPKAKTIGNYNFYDSWWISEVDLPECEVIGNYCFHSDSFITKNNTNIKNLNLPKVKIIGNYCFCAYPSTTVYTFGAYDDIYLPSCTSIGNYCFSYINSCKKDRILTVSSEGCSFGKYCFYECKVDDTDSTKINTPTKIQGKITSLQEYSFYYNCKANTTLNIDIDFSTIEYLGSSTSGSGNIFSMQNTTGSFYNFIGGFVDFSSLKNAYNIIVFNGSNSASSPNRFTYHNVTKMWIPNTCANIKSYLSGRSAESPLHIYTDATEGKSTWTLGGTVSTSSSLTTGTATPYIIMHFGATHDDFINAVHE